MNLRRAFIDAIADLDLDALAAAAGVTVAEIEAIAAGTHAPSPANQLRLARALDANPVDLFRLDDAREQALAAAPSRYVTDPATLRHIDQPHDAA